LQLEGFFQAVSIGFPLISPIISSCVTFIVYAFLGNQIVASTIFTSFSLFNIAGAGLSTMPGMDAWMRRLFFFLFEFLVVIVYIHFFVDLFLTLQASVKSCIFARLALARLQEFLMLEEYPDQRTRNPLPNAPSVKFDDANLVIQSVNLKFMNELKDESGDTAKQAEAAKKKMLAKDDLVSLESTDDSDDGEVEEEQMNVITAQRSNNGNGDLRPPHTVVLQNITFQANKGALIGIVGKVGSGTMSYRFLFLFIFILL
jgi:ABC-type multidrug transport system fused ATPase/permease subunit